MSSEVTIDLNIAVTAWVCEVSNKHVRQFGGRPIQQRSVIKLIGHVIEPVPARPVEIYLTFESTAGIYTPGFQERDGQIRIDVFLLHGQEAAAIHALQHSTPLTVRFTSNDEGPAFWMQASATPCATASRGHQ